MHLQTHRRVAVFGSAIVAFALSACGNGSVNNEESTRRAYFGIDAAIDKALNLGMQGFAMATSANIDPQTGNGDVMGTLVVGGQVDQGSSPNKGLRLSTAFTNYDDNVRTTDDAGTIAIVYNGDAGSTRSLNLSLRGIPADGDFTASGTYTGTLVQTLHMTGDLMGDVTLNLTLGGTFHRLAAGGFERLPGSTIMGTAVSPYGTYAVNITR